MRFFVSGKIMDIRKLVSKDLDELATKFLKNIEYKISKNNSAFEQLLKLKHWFIEDKPRKISFAKDFSIPIENEAGFKLLIEKFIHGKGGIYQHQSRKLFNGNARDLMLYDFGIHHLHLGVYQDPKHKKMVKGTKTVIFAYINEEEIFFIRSAVHGEWHLQNSLEILDNERPDLISHRKVNGIQGSTLTDDEILFFRNKSINYFIKINDSTYCSESAFNFYGSIQVMMKYDDICLDVEKIINDEINKLKLSYPLEDENLFIKITDFNFDNLQDFQFEIEIKGQKKIVFNVN